MAKKQILFIWLLCLGVDQRIISRRSSLPPDRRKGPGPSATKLRKIRIGCSPGQNPVAPGRHILLDPAAELEGLPGHGIRIQSRIDAVTARQRAEALKQKKLEERYDDFLKLINFVKWLESDSFWSSEVVQIVARTSSSGRLEADLVPRSGNFRIVLGNLDDADRKMDKLMRFYRDGLSRIGWDRYRIINVKYENQVVCTE